MLTKNLLPLKKVGDLYIPTFITFLVLHLNHMLITISQFSSKSYTFSNSDPTILNYLEGYTNQNSIFEYRGYPTTNIQTYQPGPIPYTYIFKFSWLLHNKFDINPIYSSNILLVIYPALLVIIASIILYKNNLKLLSIATLSVTLLIHYTNPNFNGSNKGSVRLDIGTDYITLIAILTLMMVILSYKNPDSSHMPLLTFSGLLLHNHFTSLALAPFTIIYALYLIIISLKAGRYKINCYSILPIFIILYLPLLYRVLIEPLYLFNALERKALTSNGRYYPEIWSYFYKTTPLELFINPCEGERDINSIPCLSPSNVKLYLIIIAIITFALLYKFLRTQNIFIKLIIITSFALVNYNTATGFELRHTSIASAISLSLIIYYLSKNKFTTSLGVIFVLLIVNYHAIGNPKYIVNTAYKKIEVENFSPKFISKMKKSKFKIDICYLTLETNCDNKLDYNKKPLLYLKYAPSNIGHLTILELLKNKIDLCLVDNTSSLDVMGDKSLLGQLNNLLCTKIENSDKERNELYFIREHKFENPINLYEYIKIASIINKVTVQCEIPNGTNYATCSSESLISESLHHPGAALYLKKDAIGINTTELFFSNNSVYEKKTEQLDSASKVGNYCTIKFTDSKKNIDYCYKEETLQFLLTENGYKDKVDLYDFR